MKDGDGSLLVQLLHVLERRAVTKSLPLLFRIVVSPLALVLLLHIFQHMYTSLLREASASQARS